MGEDSKISWTHHTFNPWWGCQRVSPGCRNCYAEALDKRVGGGVDPSDGKKKLRWGANAPRIRTLPSNWKQPVRWNKNAAENGERARVFCSSMADVFEDRPELVPWRRDLFELIDATPNLDWLLLTKRPQNILSMLPWGWLQAFDQGKVAPNVWFGCTVEDQQRADERIPELLKVPAKVRFLSCEPLLDRVELRHLLLPTGRADIGLPPLDRGQRIDWVIIGGESGRGKDSAPFHCDWARGLVEQSEEIGAAPFVKQLGANPFEEAGGFGLLPLSLNDKQHGGEISEFPADLRVREFPVT